MAKDRPVYVISVAAALVDMHPQTLRLYERRGLISPYRSPGQTRLYSELDIELLREIKHLTQELGVNLSGVEKIMTLRRQLEETQYQMEQAQAQLEAEVNRVRRELQQRMEELQARQRTALVKANPSQVFKVPIEGEE